LAAVDVMRTASATPSRAVHRALLVHLLWSARVPFATALRTAGVGPATARDRAYALPWFALDPFPSHRLDVLEAVAEPAGRLDPAALVEL
jgi:hypothetical protein